MAVTLFPDGVPCALQEAFDLSFLCLLYTSDAADE